MDNIPNLPLIAELDIQSKDFAHIENIYIAQLPHPHTQTTFNYAWALMKSDSRAQIQKGVTLVNRIYTNEKERRKECLYYSALGYYKLKQFTEAQKQINTLYQIESQNQRVCLLKSQIDDAIKLQGVVGLALVGSVVAVVGVMIASIFRK